MMQKSTLTDLLSYAYNETGLCEGDRIQRSIDGDPVLKSEYNEIVDLIQILDKGQPEISPESIKKILLFC